MLSRIARRLVKLNISSLLIEQSQKFECTALVQTTRTFHAIEYRQNKQQDKPSSALVIHSFENAERKEKEAYLEVLRQYLNNNDVRRGHVEFIQIALKYMDDYEVNRDLAIYKAVLDILPKGKFIPRNRFQTLFMHYPKQQEVALELLCKMERNCVIPDVEMQDMLLNIFGKHGAPLKKFWRMMYWMPKFANLNPWPCPRPAPKDPRELARLAIKKISSIDVQTIITEFETKDIQDSIDDTWIVSAMSILQEELLRVESHDKPIFVEGPYAVWVADQCIDYFVLRGDPKKQREVYEDIDDVSKIKIPFWDKQEVALPHTVHEQNDGTYFAMCATGTSTKDSLLSWIRCLQKTNPSLNIIPIIFRLTSSTKTQLYIDSSENKNEIM